MSVYRGKCEIGARTADKPPPTRTWSAEALNAAYLTFTTGGDAPWAVESDTTFHGGEPAAAQSGDIGDRQTSWIETTVTGSGTFSFWWKVSCEDDDLDDWGTTNAASRFFRVQVEFVP